MATLLLQCVAPLQAWGTQGLFSVRETGRDPSKSGIVGLLCAALGTPRTDDARVAQLAALRMGVRVDQEGSILRDYHTASNIFKAGGGFKETEPSTRYYLSDSAFLVGLEGEFALLERLHSALANPHWMLFLGRKSCPPGRPVYLSDGLRVEPLEAVLRSYPWLGTRIERYKAMHSVRLVLDDYAGSEVRPDRPISFAARRFAERRVTTTFISLPPWRETTPSPSAPAMEDLA